MAQDTFDADDLSLSGTDLRETFPRYTDLADHVTVRELPARDARRVPAEDVLRPELAAAYPYDPYTHQAEALDALADGENVCVSTSTSSGKTDVYGLQIARNRLDARDGDSTAYIVHPMKALAQDQRKELGELYDALDLDIEVGVYDGDTEMGDTRRRIRENADAVISNFMGVNTYLHNHDKWARFFRACDLVVVDESHTYTGIQGMHVGWILRRLKRVIDYYGGDPQFVLTSATIGNPKQHSEALVDEPVTVVDDDGSARGARDLVLWNPPPTRRGDDSAPDSGDDPAFEHDPTGGADDEILERQPASVEAPRVWSHLTYHDVQTLMFASSRKLAELSLQRATSFRTDDGSRLYYTNSGRGRALEAYHAGQSKEKRHSIEHQFKNGHLDGVASTSALELGINVGNIDATVLMGYPGQRQSFWQRIGRAGRGGRRSLSVLVADYSTLDQYVVSHPEYLLDNDVEDAVVDTSNDAVFAQHLLCAADELAVSERDAGEFADRDRLERAIAMWRRAGKLSGYLETGAAYAGPPRPQTEVNLYASDGTDYHVRTPSHVPDEDAPDLEPVGKARAFRDYHEGAVRVHDGRQYEVTEIVHDAPQPYIVLEPVDVNYYTRTRSDVTILDAESEQSRQLNGFTLHFGTGTVLVHHSSYDQVHIDNSKVQTPAIPTGLPPLTMETQLCWVETPDDIETALVNKYADAAFEDLDDEQNQFAHIGYMGGLHAAEHAMIKTTPLELMVDKNDLGGLSTLLVDGHLADDGDDLGGRDGPQSIAAVQAAFRDRQQSGDLPAPSSGWFVYDGVDGGLGFTRAIYDNFERLAERTRETIADCPCGQPTGCPACLMDENCGNDNAPLHRDAAIDVLDHLLGDADRDDLDAYLPDDEDARRPTLFYS